MYEAMQMQRDGRRTYSFKIRMGYFKTIDSAISFAKTHVAQNAVPYVNFNGRCVWSPLTDKLNMDTIPMKDNKFTELVYD